MNPAFSYSSLRIFLPSFRRIAQKVCLSRVLGLSLKSLVQMVAAWRDLAMGTGTTSPVIDIPGWLSRTTLDVIGASMSVTPLNLGCTIDWPQPHLIMTLGQ